MAPERAPSPQWLASLLALSVYGLAAGCHSTRGPASHDITAGYGNPALSANASTGPDATATKGRWQPAGFGGAGNFLSAHVVPQKPGLVYAASDVAGVLQSSDYGAHWQLRSRGLGNYEVSSLAVDPFDPNILYAGVGAFGHSIKAGIYRSQNGGRRWQQLTTTRDHRITFRKYRTINAIALDPKRRGTVLSGSSGNGIWRSTDHGQSWHQVLEAPRSRAPFVMPNEQEKTAMPYRAPVSMLIFDPQEQTTVYAALYGAGVFKSTAGGQRGSWRPVNVGLPNPPTVKFLAVAKAGVLFAALGKSGVYKSANRGGFWRPLNRTLPLKQGFVTAVAVDAHKPERAYLTLASYDAANLWSTEDGGRRWRPVKKLTYDRQHDPTRKWAADPTYTWWITADPAHPKRLFATDFWGIHRSDNGGQSWTEVVAGAQNTCVTSLTLDPGPTPKAGTLYATHMDAGLLATRDNGKHWRPVLPLVYDAKLAGHYWRFAIARTGKKKLLYTTVDPWNQPVGKVLRSRDGIKWKTIFENKRPQGLWMSGAILGLALDPTNPRILYLSQDGGKVHFSKDGGDSWRPTASQPPDRSFTYALAVDHGGRVFIGTLRRGLWRSTDQGRSWHQVLKQQPTIWKLLVHGKTLYASAGNDANLYASSDGGKRWRQLTQFTAPRASDETTDQGMAIAVDPANPQHLVFSRLDTAHSADSSTGLVESWDSGKTWRQANRGLGLTNVSVLAFTPAGELYAGTWCGGVWRRPAR